MKIFYDERMLLHRIPDVIFDSLPSSLLEKQIELPGVLTGSPISS